MDNTSKNFASNYQKQVLGFQSYSHLGGNEKFSCHLSPNNNCRSEFTVCLLRRQLEILCTTIVTTTITIINTIFTTIIIVKLRHVVDNFNGVQHAFKVNKMRKISSK